MSISYDTPESQATGVEYSLLAKAVSDYVDSKFQDWYLEDDNRIPFGVLLPMIDDLQEEFFEFYALATKCPLEEHHMLWVYALNSLIVRLLKLETIYSTGSASSVSVGSGGVGSGNGGGGTRLRGGSSSSTQIPLTLKNLDSNFREVRAKLSKVSGDILELVKRFFADGLDVARLLSSGSALNQLYCLTESSLRVLAIDLDEEQGNPSLDYSAIILKSISRFLLSFYRIASTSKASNILYQEIFPSLVQCIRVSYHIDQVQLLVPLIESDIISPVSPLELIENSKVEFGNLIDFYRYAAFSMLALSIDSLGSDSHKRKYNVLADFYFKVLLRFPNLNLRIWNTMENMKPSSPIANFGFGMANASPSANNSGTSNMDSLQPVLEEDDGIAPNSQAGGYNDITGIHPSAGSNSTASQNSSTGSYLTLNDRQEISLLYLLNYLLNLSSLRDLIRPSSLFSNEMKFLVRTLSTTISVDIHKSVSVSSSCISMSQLYQKEQEKERKMSTTSMSQYSTTSVKCKSMSSILTYGTYKEKLTGVINFFELLLKENISVPNIIAKYSLETSTGEMPIESTFVRLVSNIDNLRYPGKIRYANTLNKITTILKSISMVHWIGTTSINNIPENILKEKFAADLTLDDYNYMRNWKDVKVLKNDSQLNVFSFHEKSTRSRYESGDSMDEQISEQLDIHNLVAKLDKVNTRIK